MIVTDQAYREMEFQAASVTTRFARLWRFLFRRSSEPAVEHGVFLQHIEHAAHLQLVTKALPQSHPEPVELAPVSDFRWRRHPQLRRDPSSQPVPDAVLDERSARSAAVRGLFLARSRRYEDAEMAFARAACEPSIDLTAIPGFWDLSRAGMQAAVNAYEAAGRYRDATALAARLRLMYRPRSVTPLPPPVDRRSSASGS